MPAKTITKTDKRKVTVNVTSEGIRIDEGDLYAPIGHSRMKWDSTCIFLDIDELQKILAFAEKQQGAPERG